MSEMIVTAMGPDRPGLVGDLTGILLEAGLNVADSRMVNLRGQFALVLLAEGSSPAIAQGRGLLEERAAKLGLRVFFGDASEANAAVSRGLPFRLKSYSVDQKGIVFRVSDLLRKHGANIEELETRLESAAFAGSPIFTLELLFKAPENTRVSQLKRELGALCDELNCDIDLEPA